MGNEPRAGDPVLVLSRDDVAAALDPVLLRTALVDAFVAFSSGQTSVPPRVTATTPDGLLAAMPGFVPALGLVVKAVSVFPANLGTGRPSHQGLVAVFDPDDGTPVAVMDAALLTEVRTAASAAIAADLCAPAEARVLCVIGAGALGGRHLDALATVRPWTEVRIASRTTARAEALAAAHTGVRVAGSFAEAVRDADVVCLCTDADAAVIDSAWLAPGAHVSSVGRGAELPAETVRAASAADRLVVEWRGAAVTAPPAGAAELQGVDPGRVTEIGELLAGTRRLGRAGVPSVYKSTGHAIEDAAAASVVLSAARRLGLGTTVAI